MRTNAIDIIVGVPVMIIAVVLFFVALYLIIIPALIFLAAEIAIEKLLTLNVKLNERETKSMEPKVLKIDTTAELPDLNYQRFAKPGTTDEALIIQELTALEPGKPVYKLVSSGKMVLYAVEASQDDQGGEEIDDPTYRPVLDGLIAEGAN